MDYLIQRLIGALEKQQDEAVGFSFPFSQESFSINHHIICVKLLVNQQRKTNLNEAVVEVPEKPLVFSSGSLGNEFTSSKYSYELFLLTMLCILLFVENIYDIVASICIITPGDVAFYILHLLTAYWLICEILPRKPKSLNRSGKAALLSAQEEKLCSFLHILFLFRLLHTHFICHWCFALLFTSFISVIVLVCLWFIVWFLSQATLINFSILMKLTSLHSLVLLAEYN